MAKRTIVLGLLGTQLDAGRSTDRWLKWRPTVSACQHDDLLIDRFELLYPISHKTLARTTGEDIAAVSPETEVRLQQIEFKNPWDFEEVFGTLHEFARNYKFDTEKNNYLIHITTGSHVQQICLFLLTESRHLPGVLLQTSPPERKAYGTHPEKYSLIDLDLSRYDALAERFAVEQQEGQQFLKSGIETRNNAFNNMIERIEKVSIASTAPILLTGPTGAGKTRLARNVYELKRPREQIAGEFVEVNCATLRGDQSMSALFGHVKGAFTGAATARQGLLKSADGGLLFLDEIGELGLDEQAMLLRAIEEKRFLPVGADREMSADFQLIAGTNRDLLQRVAEARFREDLLARINLWTFLLPGLAERKEDIEPNLDYELERLCQQTGRKISINREARSHFVKWAVSPAAQWAANFRDLSAAVIRMATLSASGRIGIAEVREEIERLSASWQSCDGDSTERTLRKFLSGQQVLEIDLFDHAQLATVLTICGQEKSMAAAGRRLFAVSREARASTNDSDRLRKYLARFQLDWKSIQSQ